MNPYFDTEEKVVALWQAARHWENTPFVAHAALPGAGVDCVHLCAEIYKESGFWSKYELPRYTLDAGRHLRVSQVLAWLLSHPSFASAPSDQPLHAGDLLALKWDHVEHHVAIYLGEGTLVHCRKRLGVHFSPAKDHCRFLTHIFRPLSHV
ncbi:MAG TPA: NlpC/P60 family protein [Verrucomicrobiae bacterium]|jgi:cell wall-associated NlpC family hydrolase|nr:NlpC/P60 family protein [Verrucomicrobiae bacterium]